MALLSGFIGLGGTSKRVKNVATGQEYSRRQYSEHIKRGNISNEELAEINRAANPIASISRPAKGRKSIVKLPQEAKQSIALDRLKLDAKEKRRAAAEKQKQKSEKKIEQLLKKQIVRVPKVTNRLLVAGHKARRIGFNDYDDYLKIHADAKKMKTVIAIGLGITGIDVRDERAEPKIINMTVFNMMHIGSIIGREEFDSRMRDVIENKTSYFMALHYWAHLRFTETEYERKAKSAGIKKSIVIKDSPKRKRRPKK